MAAVRMMASLPGNAGSLDRVHAERPQLRPQAVGLLFGFFGALTFLLSPLAAGRDEVALFIAPAKPAFRLALISALPLDEAQPNAGKERLLKRDVGPAAQLEEKQHAATE